jgi:hypothetical protein
MTHSSKISLGRRTLQLATLSILAAASLAFAGERVTSNHEVQLIGAMSVSAARENPLIGELVVSTTREDRLMGELVVSAAREPALIGRLVVSAGRLGPTNLVFADLGAMSVTAQRDTELARNEIAQATQASL